MRAPGHLRTHPIPAACASAAPRTLDDRAAARTGTAHVSHHGRVGPRVPNERHVTRDRLACMVAHCAMFDAHLAHSPAVRRTGGAPSMRTHGLAMAVITALALGATSGSAWA